MVAAKWRNGQPEATADPGTNVEPLAFARERFPERTMRGFGAAIGIFWHARGWRRQVAVSDSVP